MNIALILAGGTGERLMRGRPKPFVSVFTHAEINAGETNGLVAS